ncbi:hypothetical protein K7640_05690 [Micromonospora sp. PLK6-60]|uniref:hypothetical protein n=1 Tax=Micromonospora sp. PLK6-60 TaxID=2873383 RepID=UPI001CA73433|nr:hypothetical protein [Micromonospora sp. PLK6-60]MBY8871333.1 hypothetical protein [Micromonospora sp. PLK6-60]
MLRKLAVTLLAAMALLAGSTGAASAASAQPDFGAQAKAAGLTPAQAKNLQQRVDKVLTDRPGGRQVSATEVRYDGLIVTVDPRYDGTNKTIGTQAVICSAGYFCIVVRDKTFSFYKCQMWDLTDWWGSSPFNNAQTSGTVFRAYDKNYNQVWSHTAKGTGSVDVTPWWHLKPC